MSTIIKISLKNIELLRSGKDAAFAVADVIPFLTEDGSSNNQSRQRIVLELRNPESLSTPIKIQSGEYSVQVRLPSGELISQTVSISPTDPYISFAIHNTKISPSSTKIVAKSSHSSARKMARYYSIDEQHLPYDSSPMRSLGKFNKPAMRKLREPTTSRKWSARLLNAKSNSLSTAVTSLKQFRNESGDRLSTVVGRVRVEVSSTQIDRMLSSQESTPRLVQTMLGTAFSLQPTRVYQHRGQESASWLNPVQKYSREKEASKSRYFAILDHDKSNNHWTTVACLPGIWNSSKTSSKARVSVAFAFPGNDSQADFRVEIDDQAVENVLEFLESGDASSALAIIQPSLQYLFEKRSNPYAATAAGYVLLNSRTNENNLPWQLWIANLSNWYPALPDGKILYATLLLQTATEFEDKTLDNKFPKELEHRRRLALEAVLSAVKRGPPLYRQGLALLAYNLTILIDVFKDKKDVLKKLNKANSAVHYLRLCADPTQAFSVFRFPEGQI